MALTNATTLADYGAGIGTQGATLKVDATNKRVGVGTDSPAGPEGSLQVGTGITFFGNTGIVSAIGGKFSGDFTVGGTLTYEDVANIDAVGIITAQSGVSIADSIFHTGDTNTAIRFPAADTFTVETAGSERLRINSAGRILKGLTTARDNFANNASGANVNFQIEGTDFPSSSLSLVRNSNDANDCSLIIGKTRATSTGGSTVVQAGDDLGDITFAGADGTSLQHGANIIAEVQSGVGNDDMPTDLIFKTNGGTTATTERLRIDSSGRLLVATTSARTDFNNGSQTAQIQLEGTSADTSNLALVRNSANAGTASLIFGKSRASGDGGVTVVNSGDTLGSIDFEGADGTDLVRAALIRCEVDGTPGSNDMPGRLVFSTTADGASSVTERLRIDSSGDYLFLGGTLRIKDSGNSVQRGAIYGDATTFNVNAGVNNLVLYTGGGERARFDSSGRLLINETSAVLDTSNALLQIGASEGANMVLYRDDTTVNADSSLGLIRFYSNAGSSKQEHARITATADATSGADDKPGRLIFYTTADGASSPTEHFRIDSAGQLLASNYKSNGVLTLGYDANGNNGTNDYISFVLGASTEKMRLDGSGRLQIGGTTDLGSQLLQVQGGSGSTADVIIANSVASTGQTSTLTFAPANNVTGGRIQCVAEEDFSTGANRTGRLVFFTRKDGTLAEKLRLTSDGALQIGSSGPDSLTNNVVYESLRIGNGLIKKYYVVDTLDSGEKTRFTFTGTNRTSAIITISASGSWTASNTQNNHPAAIFISRVMTNSSGDSADNSTVTAPFTYIYSTSNYTFTNSGSFGYTIDIANPTGDSGVTFSYEVTVQSAVSSSKHKLSSTSTV